VLDTRDPDAAAQLKALTGDALAGVLDFVGMPATAGLGIGALCKGGHYVICGLFGGELTLSLPPIAQRNISIRGSYVGNLRELREVVALARSGRLAPPPIEVRPAADANGSMEALRDGQVVGRIVLDFEGVDG
jgi:D-arabinose 1-dehydrogenase-like Zn-dependent alcohol dehydrogenase